MVSLIHAQTDEELNLEQKKFWLRDNEDDSDKY